VTGTYQTRIVKVPICSNCADSFSQWVKRKQLLNILYKISFIAIIIFSSIAFYRAMIEPVMDYDPSTNIGLSFEHIFPVIITLIITIALRITIRIFISSESNLSNYIKIGHSKVIITPFNSTRSWDLESWNQIVTEEQLEAEKLYIKADRFYKEGNFIEAIKLYDKALDLFPEYTDVIHAKNLTISNMKRYKELIYKFLKENQSAYSFKALQTRLDKKIRDHNEKRYIRKNLQNILNQMSSNGLINSTTHDGEDHYFIP